MAMVLVLESKNIFSWFLLCYLNPSPSPCPRLYFHGFGLGSQEQVKDHIFIFIMSLRSYLHLGPRVQVHDYIFMVLVWSSSPRPRSFIHGYDLVPQDWFWFCHGLRSMWIDSVLLWSFSWFKLHPLLRSVLNLRFGLAYNMDMCRLLYSDSIMSTCVKKDE